MDPDSSQPGTPTGGPLQAIASDRVNHQRDSTSSVHDKIREFNSMGIVMQSKQLERKTADAALKRAMLGREEAEAELRKYKEEIRALKKSVDEGKERERRVGERLETVMENYGRAKETHAHTQTLWEKEIRRSRKETFKTQSINVKLQEELKTTRSAVKILEDGLEREKERSRVREQEAFEARYQIVGVQEQLEEALARIKVVEQERDAFKTAAKNEEVTRIAVEGRIPLPKAEDQNDEFASPPKKTAAQKKRKISSRVAPRFSLSTMEIESSMATEMEIEQLTNQVQWERQRADRAQDMVEFLQAECEMRCCPCGREKPRPSPRASLGRSRLSAADAARTPAESPTVKVSNKVIEEDPVEETEGDDTQVVTRDEQTDMEDAPSTGSRLDDDAHLAVPKPRKDSRRSTIFCPREGIFRTVTEQEAELLEAQREAEVVVADASTAEEAETSMTSEPGIDEEVETNARMYARTPSAEPPTFAIPRQEQRESLMSLLTAPHNEAYEPPTPRIPTVPDGDDEQRSQGLEDEQVDSQTRVEPIEDEPQEQQQQPEKPLPSPQEDTLAPSQSPEPRPHTSATMYRTVTTTIPIQDEKPLHSSTSSNSEKLRTPLSSKASFDASNPALTPTMTREQALAKIRERRGRARSAENGKATPHKKMIQGKTRRDMSAPTTKGSKSR